MALYALYEETPIHADDATADHFYLCLECRAKVYLYKTRHARPRFRHFHRRSCCRLKRNTKEPLLIQQTLLELLRLKKTALETPLPSIRRIADLLWEEKKLVFEVQCSKIPLLEAKQRMNDYASLGYTVVWLLDDRIFNQYTADASEQFLRKNLAYFFNFPTRSTPLRFYDQLEIFRGSKRIHKSFALHVDLSKPMKLPLDFSSKSLPMQIAEQTNRTTLCFFGDLLWRAKQASQKNTPPLFNYWKLLEQASLQKTPSFRKKITRFFQKRCLKPYLVFLDRWIKKIC
mgnify:CR=1 FL=1